MALQLEWYIEGEKQLSRKLRDIGSNARDMSIPFGRAARNLVRTYSGETFSSEGANLGERWARLSPYTVAQKARLGYPQDILIRKGTMKRSFKSLVSSTMAVIYNTADYFKYHQSNKPRTKIPRRVMMKLGNNEKEMIVKEFQRFIKEGN